MLRKVTKTLFYAMFCRITTAHRCEVQAVPNVPYGLILPILAVGQGWTRSVTDIGLANRTVKSLHQLCASFFLIFEPLYLQIH